MLGHSYIIYKNYEKVSRRLCLPFSFYNDTQANPDAFLLESGVERLTNRPKTSRIVRKLYTEERNGFG